jgi:hypothetical protein
VKNNVLAAYIFIKLSCQVELYSEGALEMTMSGPFLKLPAGLVFALTGADLFANPDIVKKAKAELDQRMRAAIAQEIAQGKSLGNTAREKTTTHLFSVPTLPRHTSTGDSSTS